MTTETPQDWDRRYVEGDTPWDMGRPCEELTTLIENGTLRPTRVLELGCGTGINAVYLAQQGFQVTAVDVSPTAIARARRRTEEQGARVRFLCADLAELDVNADPFGFVYDRGCYHAVRRSNLDGYMDAVRRLTVAGTEMLLLAGNSDEQMPEGKGPPRVTEQEIRDDFENMFAIDRIKAFRLWSPNDQPKPLFWSCWMVRR